MLKSLSIQNFALIENLNVEFDKGLNILTGETGAGKSIIIDALMLALGNRASADLIRQNEKKAVIEATFEIDEKHPIFSVLEENNIELFGNTLIFRREIFEKGYSRSFINDSPQMLSFIKELGELIVDFHGQYEHQSILKRDSHIKLLDNFMKLEDDLAEFQQLFQEQKRLIEEYLNLVQKKEAFEKNQLANTLELNTLRAINPQKDEYEQISAILNKVEHTERLLFLIDELLGFVTNNDFSIIHQIARVRKSIESLAKFDSEFGQFLNEIETALVSFNEIERFAQEYKDDLDINPEQIESYRQRFLKLQSLVKKYGSYESAFSRYEELQNFVGSVENFENDLVKLKEKIWSNKRLLGEKALALSEKRKKYANSIQKSVEKVLGELGMQNAKFYVQIVNNEEKGLTEDKLLTTPSAFIEGKHYVVNSRGIDEVEFLFSANAGEMLRPLVNVASGGEVSRIMLALKSVLAEADAIVTLIFDEIDAGISGRIAEKTGLLMKKLAQNKQIIAITHLPQIASKGNVNISVCKEELLDKSVISAKKLDAEEKVLEVAKLISGEKLSDSAIESARHLIKG